LIFRIYQRGIHGNIFAYPDKYHCLIFFISLNFKINKTNKLIHSKVMKTTQTEVKYAEWLSAEVMHTTSRNWMSELLFSRDEQLFFDDLIKSYTLKLIESKHFAKSKKIVDKLVKLQKETDKLISIVKTHENDLEIIVNKKDELEEEENYKNAHRELIVLVAEYFENYRAVKKQLYKLIKGILKEKKQKLLLQ
jgi:hypothetical protein